MLTGALQLVFEPHTREVGFSFQDIDKTTLRRVRPKRGGRVFLRGVGLRPDFCHRLISAAPVIHSHVHVAGTILQLALRSIESFVLRTPEFAVDVPTSWTSDRKTIVLYLLLGLPFERATATSSYMIGMTAAAGALVYLVRGDIRPGLVTAAMVGTLVGAVPAALGGHRLSARWLRVGFSLLLVFVAFRMVR